MSRVKVGPRPLVARIPDLSPVALVGLDLSGRIISWNRAATRLLGWRSDEVIGRRMADLFGRDLPAWIGPGIARTDVRATTFIGNSVDVELLFDKPPTDDSSGQTVFAVIPHVAAASSTSVGGCPRVDGWAEASSAIRELGGAVRCVAVGLIGVEAVNRGYSRSTGDAVLREVGARLLGLAGVDGCALRIGGDQFVVISHQSAARDLMAMVKVVSEPIETRLGTVRVGCCVGSANGESVSGMMLLGRAVDAMHRAQVRGLGATESGTYPMTLGDGHHPRLQSLLIDAVARRKIGVRFQPIVNMSSGRIDGFEALARWNSTELGAVCPAEFVEVAEELGLIHDLGRSLLHQALDVVANERASGRWDDRRISVNLSAVQLTRADFCSEVLAALSTRALPGDVLQLELTETRFIPDIPTAAAHLADLRRLGVRIAIDDFGTGCANMAYLRDLPVDAIKIDRRFVAGLCSSPADVAVVRSIIALAADLNIEVIAEGVETLEQHLALIELGCRIAQGFLYAGDRTADDLYEAIQQ